jgi:hypothetical protein
MLYIALSMGSTPYLCSLTRYCEDFVSVLWQCLLNPSLLHSHLGLQDIIVKFFTGPVWDLKKVGSWPTGCSCKHMLKKTCSKIQVLNNRVVSSRIWTLDPWVSSARHNHLRHTIYGYDVVIQFQQDLSPVLALKKGVASLMRSVPDSLNEVFSKAVVGEPLFGSPSKSVSWLLTHYALLIILHFF